LNIKIRNIQKKFDTFTALDKVSLDISTGGIVALLGPSGCGKTTLLRTIAGLEIPDSGSIEINGIDQTQVHPSKRQVGFVFQHYALFRHMSVWENVAFGLKAKKKSERPSPEEIKERVDEVLDIVQLKNQGRKYPDQLSGGQRQRIALARSLVIKPSLMLLDEPFGALDANVRKELRRWLRKMHDEYPVTSILVTHDQEEALEVADTIVMMNAGRIEQVGSPEEIYQNPVNEFVYSFLGSVNVFHLREQGAEPVFVRPHQLAVYKERNSTTDIPGTIQRVRNQGSLVALEVKRQDDGSLLEVSLAPSEGKSLDPKIGEEIFLYPREWTSFMGEGI